MPNYREQLPTNSKFNVLCNRAEMFFLAIVCFLFWVQRRYVLVQTCDPEIPSDSIAHPEISMSNSVFSRRSKSVCEAAIVEARQVVAGAKVLIAVIVSDCKLLTRKLFSYQQNQIRLELLVPWRTIQTPGYPPSADFIRATIANGPDNCISV